jgi:hypothetical protein
MSWQSIETSPKDVSVLVCAPGHEPVSARRVSRYGADIWVTSADLFECFYPGLQFEPTHWMPLPATPESRP